MGAQRPVARACVCACKRASAPLCACDNTLLYTTLLLRAFQRGLLCSEDGEMMARRRYDGRARVSLSVLD